VELRRLRLDLMGCYWMPRMSGGMPGPRSIVAGQSDVDHTVLMLQSFLNDSCSCVSLAKPKPSQCVNWERRLA